jgi:tetratricopeptide (TPR) repeat protein
MEIFGYIIILEIAAPLVILGALLLIFFAYRASRGRRQKMMGIEAAPEPEVAPAVPVVQAVPQEKREESKTQDREKEFSAVLGRMEHSIVALEKRMDLLGRVFPPVRALERLEAHGTVPLSESEIRGHIAEIWAALHISPGPIDERGREQVKKACGIAEESISALLADIIKGIDEARGKPSGNSSDYLILGNLAYEREELDRAVAYYDKAAEVQPDYAYAWSNKGVALSRLNRHEEALCAYEKALGASPEYAHAWYGKGTALGELGRTEEELAAYERAVSIDNDYAEAWYNRGVALGNLGRYEEALTAYDRAIGLKPYDPEAWYNRGLALSYLVRHEEALRSYENAIRIKPDDAEAWYGKGFTLSNLGSHEEALRAYERAIDLKPGDAMAWHGKGVSLKRLGCRDEAGDSFERALEIRPDYAKAWFSRARLYSADGDTANALASLSRAVALDEKYRGKARKNEDFRQLRDNEEFRKITG